MEFLPLIMPAINKVLDLIPDSNARAKAAEDLQVQLLTIFSQQDQQQADIDKTEAASSNWFEASWRPFLAWTCVISLAWFYVIYPLTSWIALCIDSALHIPVPQKPTDMLNLVLALLGLGGMRSYEKSQGLIK